MPFSLRGLFVCIPFLDLVVHNAQQNAAGQWVADFTIGPANITVDANTTIFTPVVWTVTAPPGTAPVTNVNPAQADQYQIPLNNPANVVPYGMVIRVTATVDNLPAVHVDIVVKPLVTALNVVANHYAFQGAGGGWYGINLTGLVLNPGTLTCNLEVVTNPPTAAAWSHVIWGAVNTAAGGAGYALTPIGVDNHRKGIPLDGLRTIRTTVGLLDSAQPMPAPVVVDIRAPAVDVALANGLTVELHQFTFAGAGWFAVTQEDLANFNNPYPADWARGIPSRPQAYTANTAMAMNAVTLNVTAQPVGGPTNLTVRASVYFPQVNNVLAVSQAMTAPAIAIAAGTPINTHFLLGNIALGNVPNEVMHNNPLLIFWEVSADGGATWLPLQVSDNSVYVTARVPVATARPTLNTGAGLVYTYDSFLAISCDAANGLVGGLGTAQAVRTAIAGAFIPPNPNPRMQRLNRGGAATQLTYWLGHLAGNPPAQSVNGRAALPAGDLFSTLTGSIACGVWADMLIAMWALHGIGDGHRIAVNTNQVLNPVVPNQVNTAFMVRNWDYNNHGALNAIAFTHAVVPALTPTPPPAPNEAARVAGVPGQNQPAPPRAFFNHYIVLDTTNIHYYDPSYGTNAPNPLSWVNASTAGLSDGTANIAGCVQNNVAMPNAIEPNPHVVTFTDAGVVIY